MTAGVGRHRGGSPPIAPMKADPDHAFDTKLHSTQSMHASHRSPRHAWVIDRIGVIRNPQRLRNSP
jgi:hypothetical protein